MEKDNKTIDCTDEMYDKIFKENQKINNIKISENAKNEKGFFNGLKKVWNKTVFPEMIEQRKEEKRYMNEIKKRAKLQALTEIEDKLVEKYKKDELDKMSGNRKAPEWLSKIGKELGNMSDAAGRNMEGAFKINSGNKVNRILGSEQPPQQVVQKVYVTRRKKKKTNQHTVPKPRQETAEEKIKRMIG